MLKEFKIITQFFAFRGPIKYFESAPPELGRSGDGKGIIFLSPA